MGQRYKKKVKSEKRKVKNLIPQQYNSLFFPYLCTKITKKSKYYQHEKGI